MEEEGGGGLLEGIGKRNCFWAYERVAVFGQKED
jgi:hypothetical protein